MQKKFSGGRVGLEGTHTGAVVRDAALPYVPHRPGFDSAGTGERATPGCTECQKAGKASLLVSPAVRSWKDQKSRSRETPDFLEVQNSRSLAIPELWKTGTSGNARNGGTLIPDENGGLEPRSMPRSAASAECSAGPLPRNSREPASVKPVQEADINAVLPHVSAPVRDIIRLQLLCGCRPAEIVARRGASVPDD